MDKRPHAGVAAIGIPRQRQVKRAQFAVVLVLAPVNGTFERKSLLVPFAPDVLKLGRQTNAKPAASPDNGYFDSRVLSRIHAEVWADKDNCTVWIKDCKSSNGTYLNKQRLSGENSESEPFELQKNDIIELGIDIACDDNSSIVHRKIVARVERVSSIPLQSGPSAAPRPALTSSLSLKYQSRRAPSSLTLKEDPDADLQSAAVFGLPSASLDKLVSSYARSTLAGPQRQTLLQSLEFEAVSRRLVAEIRLAKQDIARLSSLKSMLEDIHREQSCAPQRDAVPQTFNLKPKPASSKKKKSETKELAEKLFTPSETNNLVLLVATSGLIVVTGAVIMALFNPPSWH